MAGIIECVERRTIQEGHKADDMKLSEHEGKDDNVFFFVFLKGP